MYNKCVSDLFFSVHKKIYSSNIIITVAGSSIQFVDCCCIVLSLSVGYEWSGRHFGDKQPIVLCYCCSVCAYIHMCGWFFHALFVHILYI